MIKNPMSMVKVHIRAITTEEGQTELHQINNLNNPLESMNNKIEKLEKEIQEIKKFYEDEQVKFEEYTVNLIIVYNQISIESILDLDERNLYDSFQNPQVKTYNLENGLNILCVYENVPEEILNNIVNFWLDKEEPQPYGKQILINSFLLRDFYGRRIIGAFCSYENGGWNFLLDGGIKLSLNQQGRHLNTNVTSEDFSKWTQGEISNMLNNPCYAYGIFLEPISLFYEWQRSLIYRLAAIPIKEIPISILEKIYDEFLEFIKEEVCEWQSCPTIVSKNKGLEVLNIEIENMRNALKGKEQSVTYKNSIIALGNRYIYMPVIQDIIEKYFDDFPKENYEESKLKELLEQLDKDNNYDKGLAMEEVAKYFLETIQRNTSNRK